MSNIRIMSDILANKIAAGEVVEKIANVVKELVENSLDAKSKEIRVELTSSGTSLIRVIDDGAGMDETDVQNAFLRHATSKIYEPNDLFFISSLGFRGEALPSIASVSKVTLASSQGNAGTKIEIQGGKLINKEKCEARKGTIIEVKDLFYNTPARLKYLKSEQTELANTSSFLEKLALAYPDVSFTLINNDKEIIKTSGSGNLHKTINELYGLDVAKNMLEVKGSNDDYDLSGFISKPSLQKGTRNYIITIVNGRVVRNNEINKTIMDAYHTHMPPNKFPIIILNIETDPSIIDVNIHPTKQDIKFSKFDMIEDLIFNEIKNTLNNNLLIPKVEVKEVRNDNDISIKTEYTFFDKAMDLKDSAPLEPLLIEEENITQTLFDFKEAEENIKRLELYPCGLVFGTYIVAQNDDGMYLIDQHAAMERINYEKVLKALKEREVIVTELLIPITIELIPSDFLILKEHLDILTKLGFEFNEFGINTYNVKAHPMWLIEGHEEESIRKIIDLVISLPKSFDEIRFQDSVAATLACKISVKGNTNITNDEMNEIIEKLVICDNPYNCPHGRPTIITFTKYELEKMFKRVMN